MVAQVSVWILVIMTNYEQDGMCVCVCLCVYVCVCVCVCVCVEAE